MSYYSKFNKLLKKMRLKPADVAKDTGISPTVFTDWKKGKSSPNAEKLLKLAKFFDVPMEYLLIDDDEDEDVDILPHSNRIPAPYERDTEFMSYIYRFWALSPEYKKDIYKAIRHAERDMKEENEKKKKSL